MLLLCSLIKRNSNSSREVLANHGPFDVCDVACSFAHKPGSGAFTMTLNVDVGSKMASTEQSHPELAEKETREKLALWDRSSEPTAPLTDKQTDSVLEIRSAAETLPVPAEVSVS